MYNISSLLAQFMLFYKVWEVCLKKGGQMGIKTRIIIIDDNKDLVYFTKRLLEMKDFLVDVAYRGRRGLEVIRKEKPDLILLDVLMPDMNGNEVLAELKNDEETKDIPVIMLTVKAGQPDRIKSLELGAYEYISKPFDTHQLLRQAANILEKRRNGEI